MSADRRAFLRQLATLPLIGGSVALIGAPSAVAEPTTLPMLLQYANWLFYERRLLCHEICGAGGDWDAGQHLEDVDWIRPGRSGEHFPDFHIPRDKAWTDVPSPSTRAAVVMAASGFDWRPVGEASL